jgi:DNA-3-methyladenine glycosylase
VSLPAPYPASFYEEDPVEVAKRLLGSLLVRRRQGAEEMVTRIVETEAYRGEEDQACHARAGRTKRTETMYGPPGRAYVYLIYGMYNMLNLVTWPEGMPSAVLIRAVEPLAGLEGGTDGPGKLCRALDIDRSLDGARLDGPELLVMPGQAPEEVSAGPRIGVDYAGEWAQRPWRFFVPDSPWLSRRGSGAPI